MAGGTGTQACTRAVPGADNAFTKRERTGMSDPSMHSSHPESAWREVARAPVQKRTAADRLTDFLEIYGSLDEESAREQASRCVQCPDPPCVTACPFGNLIPEWLALTAEGHFLEAAAILHGTSPLAEICLRVCPADKLCEGNCILNGKAEPVSVWAIEQFLNEYAVAHDDCESVIAPLNGLRVAVLGSGPGGLTCAEILSRRGYGVTVFDWRLVPGGLLVSGTPAFRVEKTIVKRRVEILERRGVTFRLGVPLATALHEAREHERFHAVFLGFGARKARELSIPGSDLHGVAQALSFLVQSDGQVAPGTPRINVTDQRVVVIGGGDMAMDCLRTALRTGAREVTCVYRRDEANLPCASGEYQNACEEGVQFVFLASPTAFLGNDHGRVTGLRLLRTRLGEPEADGRPGFTICPGTGFDLITDWIFLALGFDPEPLPRETLFASLATNPHQGVQVDDNQMTSVRGVFAGGDLVRGPSTVLQVVRDARKAAEGIHRFLGHGSEVP
jgi:glutamate synthase (NADPH) small chain